MSTKKPIVSIITASYNYAHYIPETITSVLNQTFSNFEFIIVDDGSTDNSLAIIEPFCNKDARIRLLQHPDKANHGLAATLQLGIETAQGEYIAFLESDDTWQATCLEKRIDSLVQTKADVVFNDIALFSENKSQFTKNSGYNVLIDAVRKRFSKHTQAFELKKELLLQNVIPTFSCVMVRRQELETYSFQSPVKQWLDWWLWLQAAKTSTFCYNAEKLTNWRIHTDSYNRKHSLKAYLSQSQLMWEGICQLYKAQATEFSMPYRILLKSPLCIRFFARSLSILYFGGLSGLFRRIKDKFSL